MYRKPKLADYFPISDYEGGKAEQKLEMQVIVLHFVLPVKTRFSSIFYFLLFGVF